MNKYYVYVHRRNDTNEVFYVGSGCNDRAFVTGNRTKDWKDVVKYTSFTVTILKNNMTKNESLLFEKQMLSCYGDCVNKVTPATVNVIDDPDLYNYFEIDENSPSGLIRKFTVPSTSVKSGDIAGTLSKEDYWTVAFKRRHLKVHRIIWFLAYGHIDENILVDHINGIRSDNRLCNLRLVTVAENMQNKKIYQNNFFETGVSLNGLAFTATWKLDGKRFSKSFTFAKYGITQAYANAVSYRRFKSTSSIITNSRVRLFAENSTYMEYLQEICNALDNESSLKFGNVTGVNGISVNGESLTATTRLNGKVITRTFSLNKYSKEDAIKFCKEFLEDTKIMSEESLRLKWIKYKDWNKNGT